MKIQTHMILDGGFRVINEPILRSGGDNLRSPDVNFVGGKQGQGMMMLHHRTATVERGGVALYGGDSPQGQGASVDGLKLMMRIGVGTPVKPSASGSRSSNSSIGWWWWWWWWGSNSIVPRGIGDGRRGMSRAEAVVVHEVVEMLWGVEGEGTVVVVEHDGVKLGSLRVLPLPLVRVLVPP